MFEVLFLVFLSLLVGFSSGWYLSKFLQNDQTESFQEKYHQKVNQLYYAQQSLEKARFELNHQSAQIEEVSAEKLQKSIQEKNAEIILLKAEIELLKSGTEKVKSQSERKAAPLHLVDFQEPKRTDVRQAVRNRLAALNHKMSLKNQDTVSTEETKTSRRKRSA